MEVPKEAVTIEAQHISPPSITIGRLPKRLTNALLTGPAKKRTQKERVVQNYHMLHLNINSFSN